MTWLRRLLPRARRSAGQNAGASAAYPALPQPAPESDIRTLRFVVVDVETTGLDPYRDRLLAIGAVAVNALRVDFHDSFMALVRQETASAAQNILVHGIDGTTQRNAAGAAQGLAEFLRYAGPAPLVAFHADFDRTVIARAAAAALETTIENRWLDLARLAPAILTGHARAATLDDWMEAFGIDNYRRHDALADAAATAQLLQIVLARAAAAGQTRLADLAAAINAQRWLQRG